MKKLIMILATLVMLSVPMIPAEELTGENLWTQLSIAYGENVYLRTQLGMELRNITAENILNEWLMAYGELPILRQMWEEELERRRRESNGGGGNGGGPSDPPQEGPVDPEPIVGDLNGDENVNQIDLSYVTCNWHSEGPKGDANLDGIVDDLDLSLVLANWNNDLGVELKYCDDLLNLILVNWNLSGDDIIHPETDLNNDGVVNDLDLSVG